MPDTANDWNQPLGGRAGKFGSAVRTGFAGVLRAMHRRGDVCLQPIASRLVKEIARYGGCIDKFVTPAVAAAVAQRLKQDPDFLDRRM